MNEKTKDQIEELISKNLEMISFQNRQLIRKDESNDRLIVRDGKLNNEGVSKSINVNQKLINKNELANENGELASEKLAIKNDKSIKEESTSNQSNLLVLNWRLREFVINELNKLSSLLFCRELDELERSKMLKDNLGLIEKLVDLPSKSDFDKNLNNSSNSKTTSELVLDIDNKTRLKIINSLVNNRNYAIFKHEITNCARISLIDENTQLINLIKNWPIRNVANQLSTLNGEGKFLIFILIRIII